MRPTPRPDGSIPEANWKRDVLYPLLKALRLRAEQAEAELRQCKHLRGCSSIR